MKSTCQKSPPKSDRARIRSERVSLQVQEEAVLRAILHGGGDGTVPDITDTDCPYKVEPAPAKPPNGSAGEATFLACGSDKKNKK